MLKVPFHNEHENHRAQKEEEYRLIKLGRMHRAKIRFIGEYNPERAVRRESVTAAGKETTDSAKGMRNRDTARGKGKNIQNFALEFLAENRVQNQERRHTADKPADERDTTAQIKSRLGVVDIVIRRLEKCRREKPERNGRNRIIKHEIDEFRIDFTFFAVIKEQQKTAQYPYGNHNAVQMEYA